MGVGRVNRILGAAADCVSTLLSYMLGDVFKKFRGVNRGPLSNSPP